MGTIIRAGDCYTNQQILLTAAVVSLATGCYVHATNQVARGALINLESNDIRYKIDGNTPSDNCGMIMVKGDYLMLESIHQIQNFKALNTSGGSSTAVVFYYF